MALEEKLNYSKKSLGSNKLSYALGAFLGLSSVLGCSGSGGGSNPAPLPSNSSPTTPGPSPSPTPSSTPNPSPSPTTTPQNNNPFITSTLKSTALEGDNYLSKVDAVDPDGDNLVYSLTQAPNGMSINNNDGTIICNNMSEGSFPITVNVSDNRGGAATQSTIVNVSNAFDNITGKIADLTNGNGANNIELILGHRDSNNQYVSDFVTRTGSDGSYNVSVPTGRNNLVKIIGTPNFCTSIEGNFDNSSDVVIDYKIVPLDNTFLNLFDEVARNPVDGGQLQKWMQVPNVYIKTGPALGSNIQPTQQELDLVKNIFKNEISRFTNWFTNSNINIIEGNNPPAFGTPGYIIFIFNDRPGSSSGEHTEWLNGNEIISAAAQVRTGLTGSRQLYVNKQEISQNFGARSDSNILPSIFNDPQTQGVDDYTPSDLLVGQILYEMPVGTTKENGIHFKKPDSTRIRTR